MSWSVNPDPADETERAALIAALERALAEEEAAASGQPSAWWRSGFDDLGGIGGTSLVAGRGPAAQPIGREALLRRGPAAEQTRGEPGVVEP